MTAQRVPAWRVRELTAVGFIEGFYLLHRAWPTQDDIAAYLGSTSTFQNTNMLIRLEHKGEVIKEGKRYRSLNVQRIKVFAYNRNTEMLELYGAHSKPMEERG